MSGPPQPASRSGSGAALPVHQFAVVTFPIVALFGHNLRSAPLDIGQLLVTLTVAWVATGLLWLGLARVTGNVQRAAVVTAVFGFGFLTYGYVYSRLTGASCPVGSAPKHGRLSLILFWIAAPFATPFIPRRSARSCRAGLNATGADAGRPPRALRAAC